MHIKKNYSTMEMAWWTRFETFLFLAIIVAWVALFYFFDLNWLKMPWTPLALIGTAVAFVIGFQNNSAYGRIWEARMIWGGIVNTSRTFGIYLQDMLTNGFAFPFMSLSHGYSIRWNGLAEQAKTLMMSLFLPLLVELKLICGKIWANPKKKYLSSSL